jgi:hypothetical protein
MGGGRGMPVMRPSSDIEALLTVFRVSLGNRIRIGLRSGDNIEANLKEHGLWNCDKRLTGFSPRM